MATQAECNWKDLKTYLGSKNLRSQGDNEHFHSSDKIKAGIDLF